MTILSAPAAVITKNTGWMMNEMLAQHKRRDSNLIVPPNLLKKKVGNGGIPAESIEQAQEMIENNEIDFTDLGFDLLAALKKAVADIQAGRTSGEEAIAELLFPTMQLKSQGALFHYPLISDICEVLINFLEAVETVNPDALKIIAAHKNAAALVLEQNLTGPGGARGKVLREELIAACNRYYKKYMN